MNVNAEILDYESNPSGDNRRCMGNVACMVNKICMATIWCRERLGRERLYQRLVRVVCSQSEW